MTSITAIAQAMRTVLTTVADAAAPTTRFVRRPSKLTGALFVQTLVLGWLGRPQSTLGQLSQTAAEFGLAISQQGLDRRFTAEAAALLWQVLNAAVRQVVTADPAALPILRRFSAVTVQDSSTIVLPPALADQWPGCGGNTEQGDAALKIQVRWDLLQGGLEGPLLEAGRSSDRSTPLQRAALPPGALRLADLGYFDQDVLAETDEQGVYFLSHLHATTALYDQEGKRVLLEQALPQTAEAVVDRPVQLGARRRLPVRLLAVRVPAAVAAERRRRVKAEGKRRGKTASQARLGLADWTVLVTNVPVALLSAAEALVLVRIRWQVELLFKLWKRDGQIDEWRSKQPWRILCEVYAKLIAMVVQHWVLLVSCWGQVDRSLVKAAQTVRASAVLLSSALAGVLDLGVALAQIQRTIALGCRMNRRQQQPNTYQLLLDLPPDPSLQAYSCPS